MASKVISTRFSDRDVDEIMYHAESLHMSPAEFLRHSYNTYITNNQEKERLDHLEKRLYRRFFSILCATASLTNSERDSVARVVNAEFGEVIVK